MTHNALVERLEGQVHRGKPLTQVQQGQAKAAELTGNDRELSERARLLRQDSDELQARLDDELRDDQDDDPADLP